jgi:hypothetical protein
MQQELIKAALTLVTGYLLFRLTLRQARVTYFSTIPAACMITNPVTGEPFWVWMYQLTIQNTGKAVARNLRVAHHFMPRHWQVIQSIVHQLEQVNGQNRIIKFDALEPGMFVTISYIDFDYTAISTAHDHVRFEEGIVKPVPVQLQRVFPKYVQMIIFTLLMLGLYTLASMALAIIVRFWS